MSLSNLGAALPQGLFLFFFKLGRFFAAPWQRNNWQGWLAVLHSPHSCKLQSKVNFLVNSFSSWLFLSACRGSRGLSVTALGSRLAHWETTSDNSSGLVGTGCFPSLFFFPFFFPAHLNCHSELRGNSVILLKCNRTAVDSPERCLLGWGRCLLYALLGVLDRELSGGNL